MTFISWAGHLSALWQWRLNKKSKIKKGFEAWNQQKKKPAENFKEIPTEIDRIEKTCILLLTGNQKLKSTHVELKPTFYFSS